MLNHNVVHPMGQLVLTTLMVLLQLDKPNFDAEVYHKYRLFHEVWFYESQSAFGAAV